MRVIVLVPAAADRVDRVVGVVRAWPGADVATVWTGDPYLRPPGRWADPGDRLAGLPTGIVRCVLGAELGPLALGLAVAARGDRPALLLDAGRVVVAPSGVPELPTGSVGVLRRGVPPADGLAPSGADLAAVGPFGTAVLSVPPDLAATLLARLVDVGTGEPPGPVFAALLADLTVAALPGEVVGWPVADPIGARSSGLLDVSHVHPDEPWRLDTGPVAPRLSLVDRADLDARFVVPEPVLPGGVVVDATVRRVLAANVAAHRRGDEPLAPDPWRSPEEFRRWLATPGRPWEPAVGRYWTALWHERPDLRVTFPDPAAADLERFRGWADHRHRFERHSPLLRSYERPASATWVSDGCDPGGVDVIGYFGSEVSLGSVSGLLAASLEAAGVPHRRIDQTRTGSPRRDALGGPQRLAHEAVVVVANHDQVEPLLAEHGDVLAGRRLYGFWHWDVEHVPAEVLGRMAHFTEIWVENDYTRTSLVRAAGEGASPPVRSLTLPIQPPEPSAVSRADLGLPDGRPIVLVTFDHLSLAERKNPIGAIEAFRRAFPEPTDDGPLLVVKSMNAAQRWVANERIRRAAAGRPDIVVVDRMLPKADQLALIAHADVLVSLHRCEGLGLHLIEAMFLGTPTIATRYSGNLAFMDDTVSLLVDARLVPVERAEGYYPDEASWADPDLDQAAGHLRRLLGDPALAARLADAARARTAEFPSLAATGRTIAAWCGIEPVADVVDVTEGG